jgi:hypothetical protein
MRWRFGALSAGLSFTSPSRGMVLVKKDEN